MTPDKYTISETFVSVGDGHNLYIHDWGNKSAKKPIIFLHGGPGSFCQDKHKGIFNPENQRVIFFDQRGSGKSTPYGELSNNTTDELVEDINKITDHLKIDKFILQGGSWGSCLAFAYAIAHPQRVIGIVLAGIYTCSQSENDWLNNGGFKSFYPDAWDEYLARTPQEHRDNPTAYHMSQIASENEDARKLSAYAYSCLEASLMKLDDRFTPDDYETFDPAGSIIEMTYIANNGFMPDRFIIENAHKIIAPVWLVQGRYDIVCPPVTAYELSSEIPNCKLILTTSGHKAEHESWNLIRTILGEITEDK